MSDETMDVRERVVIIIDPFTRKAEMFNLITGCERVEVQGQVDIEANEHNEVVVKIDASFTMKGLICKFEKPANDVPEEQP